MFKENINKVLLGFSIVIFIFISTLFINNWIIDKKNEADMIALKAEIEELEGYLVQYRENYSEVFEIRNRYRSSIREILQLLYAKEFPMSVGGIQEDVGTQDEIIFLQLRQTISTMEDDQEMLADVKQYLTARRGFIDSFPFIWPVETNGVPRVSSGYGFRDDLFDTGRLGFHAGIDIPGMEGEPIIATADGRVRAVIHNDERVGDIVVLEHDFGFTTGYSHMSTTTVLPGQLVSRGDIVGTMGSEGTHSTGPHLHYEIRKNNQPMDPLLLLATNY